MITVLSEQWDRLSSSDPNRLSKEIIEYVGLSTDEKPTDLIVTGSTFLEADTGDIYMFSEETSEWFKMLSVSGEGGEGGGSALPSVTTADNGDVLTVVNGVWNKAEPQGGTELPEVTSADNGKVLTVVDGEWDKAEAGSDLDPVIITIGADEVTLHDNGQITFSLEFENSRMADVHDQFMMAATNNIPVYLDLTFTTQSVPDSPTHISGYAATTVDVSDNSVYAYLTCRVNSTLGITTLDIHAYKYQSSKMIIMAIGGRY